MISQTLKAVGHIKCSSFSNCANFLTKNASSFNKDHFIPIEFSNKKFKISKDVYFDSFSNQLQKNENHFQNVNNRTEFEQRMIDYSNYSSFKSDFNEKNFKPI